MLLVIVTSERVLPYSVSPVIFPLKKVNTSFSRAPSGFEASYTVTLHSATKLPSTVLTLITLFPSATAVITPSDTVATSTLLLSQVILLSLASLGFIVAVKVFVSPMAKFIESVLRLTLSTDIVEGV